MWESFEIGGRRGRPRIYCLLCEPPGTQIVMVNGWYKRRRRWPCLAGSNVSCGLLRQIRSMLRIWVHWLLRRIRSMLRF